MAFHPYLFFGGNCREAFTRYREIFGGELFLLPMSDAPSEEAVPADQADLIIHAALTSEGSLLMASDDPTGNAGPIQGMYVNYTVADVAEAERVFEALADGGEVTTPLAETFFSPKSECASIGSVRLGWSTPRHPSNRRDPCPMKVGQPAPAGRGRSGHVPLFSNVGQPDG